MRLDNRSITIYATHPTPKGVVAVGFFNDNGDPFERPWTALRNEPVQSYEANARITKALDFITSALPTMPHAPVVFDDEDGDYNLNDLEWTRREIDQALRGEKARDNLIADVTRILRGDRD